jgi:hypothetical protein
VLLGEENRRLLLVDFSQNVRTVVADSGTGPSQIQDGTVLTSAGDSAFVFDSQHRRLLVFTPSGTLAGTRSFGGTPGNPFSLLQAMNPRSLDASGAIFGETSPVLMPSMNDMMVGRFTKMADSLTVERFDPATGRTASIVRIRNSRDDAMDIKMNGDVATISMPVSDMRADDEWAALPDGRVAVLRDGNYQVEFDAPGKPVTHGPPIAHVGVVLTDDEKKNAVESMRKDVADMNARRAQVAAPGGAAIPKMITVMVEPASWPAMKAPYSELMSSPDGRLWVMTPTAFHDKAFSYDVLDGTGAIVAHVRTAPHESIVGLGRGTVYTFRSDTTELEHLRRYVLPTPLGSPK